MKFWLGLLALSTLLIVSRADPEKIMQIREFDPPTLSRLGRKIYRHDQLAWQATDVVMAQVGIERLKKDGGRGWIVDTSNPEKPLVRFLRASADGSETLCDVTFIQGKNPELSVPPNRALNPVQRAQAIALETAKQRFTDGTLMWCGGNPNTVVLDDPDGSGFLIYFLRAKPAADQVPIGGHYRFTVTADGRKVKQVDRLFASCLTLPKTRPLVARPRSS